MSEVQDKNSRRTVLLFAVAIIIASVICYHRTFHFPFHFDGEEQIADNPAIAELSWKQFPRGPRSLVNASWRLNYQASGKNPLGYRLVNIAIHITSGLLLLGLIYRTLRLPSIPARYRDHAGLLAGIIALAWTVHPLQTQSVTYIIQRYESLMGMFFLLAFFCLACSAGSSRKWLWLVGCFISCFMAMTSKEVAVVLPLLLLWYDRAFASSSWKELARTHVPLYIAASCTLLVFLPFSWQSEQSLKANNVVYVVETSIADGQVQQQTVSGWDYLLSQPQTILFYLQLVLVPYGQSIDHGWRATTSFTEAALPGLLVLLLLGCTIWAIKAYPRWSFLGGWFFLILAPTSSILPIKDVAVEHRMYLPSGAVLAFLVLISFELIGRQYNWQPQSRTSIRRGLLTCGVALAIVLGGVTLARNEVYRTKLSLWTDVTAKAPEFARGHYAVARAHIEGEHFMPAIKSLEQAIECDPTYAEAYVSLGRLVRASQPDYATQLFATAVKLSPTYSEAHNNLGAMLTDKMPSVALEHFQQAIALNERNADAHNNIANLLARSGRLSEAIHHYEVAISLRPDFELAARNLNTVRQLAATKVPEQANSN